MFEDQVPKLKIGALKPLSVVDNSAYEFYRIAPPGVMLVMIPVGLGKFSKDDVERVFAPLDGYVDQLMERGVDLIMQSGVPLPLLIGIEAHDRLIDRIEKRSGKPATSSVLGWSLPPSGSACAGSWWRTSGRRPMNRTLGEFFARGGTAIAGVAAEVMGPDKFRKSKPPTTCSSPMSSAGRPSPSTRTPRGSISAAAPGCRSRSARRLRRSSAGQPSPIKAA
jgi:hypothetical protein